MKKVLIAIILTVFFGSSCFAEGSASRFSAEEKTADALIEALVGKGTYEQVSRSFASELKEKLAEKEFALTKERIRKDFGKVKDVAIVVLNKQYHPEKGYSGVDELVYTGKISKEKHVRFIIAFGLENDTPKIIEYRIQIFGPENKK